MERRDVLRLGAAAALSGCAVPAANFRSVPPPPKWTPAEVDSALADLDATVANITNRPPSPSLFIGEGTLDARRAAHGHDLVVRTLAAMHVAATFNELPPDVQKREDVQRRMWRALPMIDSAMMDITDYVERLTPVDRKAIQEQLRKKPNAGMDAIGRIDAQAAAAGVSNRRRLQMRAITTHLSWRMNKQSVDATLDDTLDKVRRIRERHVVNEQVARAMAAKVAEAELFDKPSHVILAAGVDEPEGASARHRAARVLGVGGILFGIGAVVAGVGGILLATNGGNDGGVTAAGLVMITVGAALGLAAIITLIVGAVMLASAPPAPEQAEDDHSPALSE